MSSGPINFEAIAAKTADLQTPRGEDQRHIEWFGSQYSVGIAREHNGGYELFLRGERLTPSDPLVRRHMEHDDWTDQRGDFKANRLVLPNEEHFMSVATYLASECLREGLDRNLEGAYRKVEPLFAMALRGTALPEAAVIGLIAELAFLRRLMLAHPTLIARCLSSWKGSDQGRDFQMGLVDIEVKSTRGMDSNHHIQSISQVDPRRTRQGPAEQLYLLSCGIAAADSSDDDGFTLSSLVSDILHLIEPGTITDYSHLQRRFLAKVWSYGVEDTECGYDHDRMKDRPAYNIPVKLSFCRMYDMNDSAVGVIRGPDIDKCGHVPNESVQFRVTLPNVVNNGANPIQEPHIDGFCDDLRPSLLSLGV